MRVALYEGGAGVESFLHDRERRLLGLRAVPKRRDDFSRGRYVAHTLVGKVCSTDAARIAVIPDAEGVPWAVHDHDGRLPVSLSISHTSGLAAAAVVALPCRVGVDVERPISSKTRIPHDYFETCELALCAGLEGNALALRAGEIWALKEAGLKALGVGLRVPMTAVRIEWIGAHPGPTGWHSVEMVLGKTAPDSNQGLKAWVMRRSGACVALAARGQVPEPIEPMFVS